MDILEHLQCSRGERRHPIHSIRDRLILAHNFTDLHFDLPSDALTDDRWYPAQQAGVSQPTLGMDVFFPSSA